MQFQSVRCNHCGAPLEVQESARFVTCNYCKSELTIHRNESTITTEVLADISRKTDHIVGHLGLMRVQGEIDRLDREWQMKREELMTRDRRGKLIAPKPRPSALQGCGLMAAGLLVVGAIVSRSEAAPVLIIVYVVAAIIVSVTAKNSPYLTAKAQYDQQRAKLLAELNQTGAK